MIVITRVEPVKENVEGTWPEHSGPDTPFLSCDVANDSEIVDFSKTFGKHTDRVDLVLHSVLSLRREGSS